MANRVAAIVVTYNRCSYLVRCIQALREQTCPTDILIIDNASTDGTAEAVRTYTDAGQVQYYNTGANLGGAGGFQYGMRLATEAGYDYLWIMDDDCIPEPTALEALSEADRQLDGQYGFLSGMAYWRDGSLCLMNIQKTGLRTKIADPTAPLTPVIMATFVSAFFPAARVRECGLPIKEFFIWADDLEYTRRLSRRFPCYAVGGCRVLHDMQDNQKVNIATDRPERLPRYRYLYRNEVYVYRREGLRGWIYLICRLLLHSARVIAGGTQKGEKLRVIWGAFLSGLRFHPAVEYPKGEHHT